MLHENFPPPCRRSRACRGDGGGLGWGLSNLGLHFRETSSIQPKLESRRLLGDQRGAFLLHLA